MLLPSRPTVRLIGLGNIGFRHLQGLAAMAGDIRLEGYDLADTARERAGLEWSGHAGSVGDFSQMHDHPADLAILATSAAGREAMIRQELDRGTRRLLLEKVVFTERAAFERTQTALEAVNATAYVNTARRLWPLYQKLAQDTRTSGQPVALEVSGKHLGLACNGVHFIDLLQMLSGDIEVTAVDADLSRPWPSKREGYFEIWGSVRFRTPGGSTLLLSVAEDGPEAPLVSLTHGGRRLTILEGAGHLADPAGTIVQDLGRAPYQSELSALYARPMLADQAPMLPALSESARAHNALLAVLEPAFAKAGFMTDQGLPIT
jgi:predicted dehydrogenase